MKKKLFSLLFLVFCIHCVHAQKIRLIEGDLKELKGEKAFNIEFTYDNMVVGTGIPEKKYLEEKKRDWDVKEPGKGDEFVSMWFTHRKKRYEPAFIESFEHYSNLKLSEPSAKYTLIVKTSRTEGGWNMGVISHGGEIDGEVLVVESQQRDHVIARVVFNRFQGRDQSGGDFEMTYRIKAAYSATGRWVGDFFRKKIK